MIGADRFRALRPGYIGDSRGGLVLHDDEQNVTIDLCYGVQRELALRLADKLAAVLQEIHDAPRLRPRPTWVRLENGREVRLEGLRGLDHYDVRLANDDVVTVRRDSVRRMDGERV